MIEHTLRARSLRANTARRPDSNESMSALITPVESIQRLPSASTAALSLTRREKLATSVLRIFTASSRFIGS